MLLASTSTAEPVITSQFVWFAFTTFVGLAIWFWKDRRKMQDSKNEKLDNLENRVHKTIDDKLKEYDRHSEKNRKAHDEKNTALFDGVTKTLETFEDAVKDVGSIVRELSLSVTRLDETTKHVNTGLDKNGRSTERAAREAQQAHQSAKSAHNRLDEISERLEMHVSDRDIH